ncbi:hypothetical protein BH10PLA2_BH10PLA2_18790 [soil metagenome]
MSRKSPAPKPKSAKLSRSPASKNPPLAEERARYLLDYISRVNRHTLLALHQLGQAPDCHVAKIPALLHFVHTFEKHDFHIGGSLTATQAAVLEKAAQTSLEAFVEEAMKVARTLTASLVVAAEGLVDAVEMNEEKETVTRELRSSAALDESPEEITGCCYYYNQPPQPDVPLDLCVNSPDYRRWVPGQACMT